MEAKFKGTYKRFNAVQLPSRRLMIIIFFPVAVAVILAVAVTIACIVSLLRFGAGMLLRAAVASERDSSCRAKADPTRSRL